MSDPPAAGWRVLVVEDDRAVARISCRYISRQPGFDVIGVASTGRAARELVAQLHPHVVLLDLGLPGRNGLALLRELRRAGDPVEVIVVTAHSEPAVVRASMQLGVVDYLVKPFWPERLGEALAAFAARMDELGCGRRLDQEAIDRLRHGAAADHPAASPARRARLARVRAILADGGVALTANEVAEAAQMARVTARRYLEQLVALGQCTVDTLPDGPGRPRKAYRIWLSAPVGAAARSADGVDDA